MCSFLLRFWRISNFCVFWNCQLRIEDIFDHALERSFSNNLLTSYRRGLSISSLSCCIPICQDHHQQTGIVDDFLVQSSTTQLCGSCDDFEGIPVGKNKPCFKIQSFSRFSVVFVQIFRVFRSGYVPRVSGNYLEHSGKCLGARNVDDLGEFFQKVMIFHGFRASGTLVQKKSHVHSH